MSVRKFYVYADSRGRVFYCTSPAAAERYFSRSLKDSENAVFQGENFVNPVQLVQVARGVYRLWEEEK